MKTRITILASERKDFPKKTGGVSTSFICQCIVHGEKIEVGVCRVPARLVHGYVEGQEAVEPRPGDYMAEYGLNVNWQTKQLEGVMVALEPITGSSAGASVKQVVAQETAKA